MFLFLLVVGAILLACVYWLADYFLIRNVRRAEKMEVSLQLERARRVFDAESSSLAGFVEDWSAWDDTCRFLNDTNSEYIATNLSDEFYAKNRVNLVLLINNQGAIIYGRHFKGHGKTGSEILQGTISELAGFDWLAGLREGTNGVAVLPEGLALLAVAPVISSHYSGPARGMLVMARYMDAMEQGHVARLYGVLLHLCESPKARSAISGCAGCRSDLDIPLLINPMNGSPPVKIGVRIPHLIAHERMLADRYVMFGSLLALYVIVCTLVAIVIRWSILRRFNLLAEFVRSIKPNENRTDRVHVGEADELTLLADAINRMLDDMMKAQAFEKKVREVQKMHALGSLAVGIAHDFNNMLYVITGYTTMIGERLKGDAVSRDYLDRIVKAVDLSSSLVRQLMSFGRQDEHGVFRCSLASIIRESLSLFQASLPASISIQQHLMEAPDMIRADPAQIYQMLMNLYLNAFHAMKTQGGVIIITTEMRQPDDGEPAGSQERAGVNWLCLSVADSGYGIPEEDMGRVFDPYFTTKSVEEGSGLGLAVVYHIVESAGGIIHVASKAGEGAVFSVFFPLDETEAYQPSAAQVERSHESSSIPKT